MARNGLTRDARFQIILIASARSVRDDPAAMGMLRRTAENLGLTEGMELDLIACNNLSDFGREAWLEVLKEPIDPQPELYAELDGPQAVYVGRYVVPGRD